MMNFTLPNFFDYYYINQFLIMLSKTNPEYFQEDISFIQHSGPFPYLSWNGGFNCNFGGGAYYNDFINCYKLTSLPLRLNMANIFLEDYDYYDSMGNAILEANHNGSNLIEISNLDFMEFIQNKYPNYKFVLSKQADLILEFTPELLNQIIELNQFDLIGLPDKYNDNDEFLNQLSNKRKFEITVNPLCPAKCKNYNACLMNIHKIQLEYSNKQPIQECIKSNRFNNFSKLLTLSDLKKKFVSKGFVNFTFSPCVVNPADMFNFYVHYFIKEEYQSKVANMFSSSGGAISGS